MNAWFEEQENATLAAINLFQALTSSVYVIWYEAPQEPEFDSRALFTRLNVGRIPLTDAELVNASILTRIERQHETAAQWDSIERDLRKRGLQRALADFQRRRTATCQESDDEAT